jgi:hypothetical protein
MVMEGYLLLLIHKLGQRRKNRLPRAMLNGLLIIAFPFVSFRRLALPFVAG